MNDECGRCGTDTDVTGDWTIPLGFELMCQSCIEDATWVERVERFQSRRAS